MTDHTKTIEALTVELDKAGEWEHKARDLARQTISESDALWTADQWHKKMIAAWHGENYLPAITRAKEALRLAASETRQDTSTRGKADYWTYKAALEALSTITTGEDK